MSWHLSFLCSKKSSSICVCCVAGSALEASLLPLSRPSCGNQEDCLVREFRLNFPLLCRRRIGSKWTHHEEVLKFIRKTRLIFLQYAIFTFSQSERIICSQKYWNGQLCKNITQILKKLSSAVFLCRCVRLGPKTLFYGWSLLFIIRRPRASVCEEIKAVVPPLLPLPDVRVMEGATVSHVARTRSKTPPSFHRRTCFWVSSEVSNFLTLRFIPTCYWLMHLLPCVRIRD